jgi:hypothetical protein
MGAAKNNPNAIAKRKREEVASRMRTALREIKVLQPGHASVDEKMAALQDRLDRLNGFEPSKPFEARRECVARRR